MRNDIQDSIKFLVDNYWLDFATCESQGQPVMKLQKDKKLKMKHELETLNPPKFIDTWNFS